MELVNILGFQLSSRHEFPLKADEFGDIMVNKPENKRLIEEIARQFAIPLEEAEKRMEVFMGGIPKTALSDEIRIKKAEAISKLPTRKKGGSALKITLSLDYSEAEDFLKLQNSMKVKTKADVLRRLFREAITHGSTKTTKSLSDK